MARLEEKTKKLQLSKEDFNAGSPFSCWLREEMIGEICAYKYNMEGRGLIEKYNVKLYDGLEDHILYEVKCLDDYPDDLCKVAEEIIQCELDPEFKYQRGVMKKKYIGITSALSLINNKVYDVISVEKGWYRIVDECGEDYLYPPHMFVNVEEDGYVDSTVSDYILSILK